MTNFNVFDVSTFWYDNTFDKSFTYNHVIKQNIDTVTGSNYSVLATWASALGNCRLSVIVRIGYRMDVFGNPTAGGIIEEKYSSITRNVVRPRNSVTLLIGKLSNIFLGLTFLLPTFRHVHKLVVLVHSVELIQVVALPIVGFIIDLAIVIV